MIWEAWMKYIGDNFGYTLKNIRETMGYTQDEVYHGIVSRTVRNKYEGEEIIPDMLMFQVILERLGVSDERFEFIIPDALHEFFEWYINCQTYADKGDWENLVKERERFDVLMVVNERIQNQYKDFVDYIINRRVKNDTVNAYRFIRNSISHTIKNIDNIVKERKRLSVFEWHLVANLYDIEYELFPDKSPEISVKVYELFWYAKDSIDDKLVMNRVMPRLALTFLRNDKCTANNEMRLDIEHITLKLLTELYSIREIPEILKLLIEDEPVFYKKKAYMKHKEAVENVFAMVDVCPSYKSEIHITNVKKYMVLSDVLRLRRRELGLRVEKLIENICDVKTYSRAELGKTYPKKTILTKISQKLGLRWLYFKGEVESAEYEDFMLMSECRRLTSIRKYEKLCEEKERLRQRLDMTIPINKQAVEGLEIFTEEISDEEMIERLWTIFSYTGKALENRIYTREEIEILSNIARLVGAKEPYKGIEMLENLLDYLYSNKEVFEGRTIFSMKDLSWLYKNIKEYEKSYYFAENVMKIGIKENVADLLLSAMDYISTIEEELGNIEKAKKICKDMFYIAELYERCEDASVIRAYYEREFDNNVDWY